jgi:hypothetical protein
MRGMRLQGADGNARSVESIQSIQIGIRAFKGVLHDEKLLVFTLDLRLVRRSCEDAGVQAWTMFLWQLAQNCFKLPHVTLANQDVMPLQLNTHISKVLAQVPHGCRHEEFWPLGALRIDLATTLADHLATILELLGRLQGRKHSLNM